MANAPWSNLASERSICLFFLTYGRYLAAEVRSHVGQLPGWVGLQALSVHNSRPAVIRSTPQA
jgi:hypothetical protein